MAIENSIIFGGVNSADYGIYISGEGVFNAPKRDVEMITIPGRNGEFALDQGRFENITVTYPAFNFEPNGYDTFAQNLSDFRNAICSQKGYQRLTDTFHPDEYRMAVYTEGLEIKPIKYNTASQFNITFDCKPQRFLTSGEETTTMPGKNLIPYPYYRASGYSSNGATTTYGDDGVLTVNKITGSGTAYFSLYSSSTSIFEPSTQYILSFELQNAVNTSIYVSIGGTDVAALRNKSTGKYEVTFTTPSTISGTISIGLYWGATVTETDAIIKPMIRLASETDPHYVRYNGIYNPTLFEASPMLEVTGYGTIGINEDSIAVNDVPLGEIQISTVQSERTNTATATLNTANLNTGDSIYIKDSAYILLNIAVVSNSISISVQNITNGTFTYHRTSNREVELRIIPRLPTYSNGTFRQNTTTVTMIVNIDGTNYNATYTVTTQYKSDQTMVITGQGVWPPTTSTSTRSYLPAFYGNSTMSLLPTPMYIDLDFGEAYGEVNGEIISFNNTVSMPANLPTLKTGTNEITYGNTVTGLKIIPRWWKI